VAAKLRILTKPSPTPPMGQYYVEHRRAGTVATPLSSLAASKCSTLTSGQALEVNPPNKGATAAPPPPCTHFTASTVASPNFCTDSEATHPMLTFEQLEEWNRNKGISFESKTTGEPGTYTGGGKMEEAGDKREVWQEGDNVLRMYPWTLRKEPTNIIISVHRGLRKQAKRW
jgi:hypothetical protein